MSKYHQLSCLSTAAWGRVRGSAGNAQMPCICPLAEWQNVPWQKLIKVKKVVNNAEIAWFFGDSY